MKVAVVADVVYPYTIGGTEKRIYEIFVRLARKGHQITIYSMKWWAGPNTIMHGGLRLRAISPRFPLYKGKKRSLWEALFFALFCFQLLREDFDILDVDHMPHLVLFSTRMVALLKRKKLHVLWNEVWGPEYWLQYMGRVGVIAAVIEKVAALLPDKCTAVSEHTAGALTKTLRVPPRKIAVVPNGISLCELEAIAPASLSSDIIFVGRLVSHKNVDVLIQSVALLKARHPAITCLIVGRGPEQESLARLVYENGLQGTIRFIEYIEDHCHLYALMKSSRVCAFPSTREGFGIVVLEANGCGLPVVTTDHPQNAARALVREGVNGSVITLSRENLARAIEPYLLLSPDPHRYTELLRDYDWDDLARRMEGVLVACLA